MSFWTDQILQPILNYFISEWKCKCTVRSIDKYLKVSQKHTRDWNVLHNQFNANFVYPNKGLVCGQWRRQPDALLHQQDGGRKFVVHNVERPDARRALPGGGGGGDQRWHRHSQSARVCPHQWVHNDKNSRGNKMQMCFFQQVRRGKLVHLKIMSACLFIYLLLYL